MEKEITMEKFCEKVSSMIKNFPALYNNCRNADLDFLSLNWLKKWKINQKVLK